MIWLFVALVVVDWIWFTLVFMGVRMQLIRIQSEVNQLQLHALIVPPSAPKKFATEAEMTELIFQVSQLRDEVRRLRKSTGGQSGPSDAPLQGDTSR
jgi:hypothetical protein